MSPSRDGRSRDPRRPARGPAPRGGRPDRPRGGAARPRRPAGQEPPRRRPARPRPGSGPPPPSPLLRRRFRRGDPQRRLRIAVMIMAVVMVLFTGRLVYIQGINAATYAEQAADSRMATIDIPTTRGSITDVDGNPFALSVEVRTVFVDPEEIRDDERDRVVSELSSRFDLDPDEVAEKVGATPSRYEVVKREVPPDDWEDLSELGLQGVGAQKDYKRVYPEESGAADLVGFVGSDGAGLEGMEAVLDSTLAGRPGKQQVEMGATGTQIPMAGGYAREPVPGKDVRLTLDQDVQWYAQQALAERAEELGAQGGSIIAMRPTGEIVAMADYPTYDPSDIAGTDPENRKNGAVSEVFEPGSTNKVITAAAALEEGKTSPESVYTVPYSMEVYDRTFKDSHIHDTERMTLNGIIAQSSNVGTIKVAQQLGAQGLYDYLGKFGFGRPTGLDLPGEEAGVLKHPDDWWGTQLASISFGQGLSVTAMQMASVYATIANDGVRVEPRLVAGTVGADGEFRPSDEPRKERVVSEETSDEVKLMLEAVTGDQGTATQARIDGYRVAGKTGTANRVDPETGRYESRSYTSMFVGFAPADDPELIVQVVLHNPQKEYYGGEAAGPLFKDVMSFGLKSLKIPPSETEPPNIKLFEDE
ncbi:peptidoglycan D,D-transpeptidase FtsI family protein [Nocardiopsis suaedae]|uniref:Penicillin-binding protein 2 n=1 Tax=Nocardiopsis suaedae TaxID=3018444 RepID=A0ABT4TVS3_9ACTN|nr:penicillin-binding protein 2 [Nocardiopsis suaedae]MDA2808242.1 penicillin-binding protein 2 [Nocardiopsis suaedae]